MIRTTASGYFLSSLLLCLTTCSSDEQASGSSPGAGGAVGSDAGPDAIVPTGGSSGSVSDAGPDATVPSGGSGGSVSDAGPDAAPDSYVPPGPDSGTGGTEQPPQQPGAFDLLEPQHGVLLTDSRQVTLQWDPYAGTDHYEVYLNVSRNDYDWMASGSLLERYTLIGETTGTSLTTDELPDRWTYLWFVVSVGADGSRANSNVQHFGLYVPSLEMQDDGIEVVGGARDLNKNGTIEPYENWHLWPEERAADLLSRMSIQQKVFQLFYNQQANPEAGWQMGPRGDIRSLQESAAATEHGIPVATAGDTIHGYSTGYPTQIGLAATRDLDLIYRLTDMQRHEQMATGDRGVLGPLAEVDTHVGYSRFQEGCGEDADFCAGMVRAMTVGLQGGPELSPNSVMGMQKHWPGNGAGGEHWWVPGAADSIHYDAVTYKWHVKPWVAAVEAGIGSIMPGYGGSVYLDPGGPRAPASQPTIDRLRNELGFDGLITTDWMWDLEWNPSLLAGCDVLGGADPTPSDNLTWENVLNGATGIDSIPEGIPPVPEDRIEDAARRVLLVKLRLGLFENPYPNEAYASQVNRDANLELATEACRKSLTLLKNDGVLPLSLGAGANVVVSGSEGDGATIAEDHHAYHIWATPFRGLTVWEGLEERAAIGGFNLHREHANPDLGVFVMGENGYTHWTYWDNDQLRLPDAEAALLSRYRDLGVPIVVVWILSRPYIISWSHENANAMVAAYRPGDGVGTAVAELLFGDIEPVGKLPFQLPRSEDQVGAPTNHGQAVEHWDLPYDLGATDAEREQIRSLIDTGQPVPTDFGDPLYPFGAGIQGYNP